MSENREKNVNKDSPHPKERIKELIHREAGVPLFLRDHVDDQKNDAQDEKDKSAE